MDFIFDLKKDCWAGAPIRGLVLHDAVEVAERETGKKAVRDQMAAGKPE